MVDRSSAAVLLLYRDLRSAGRALHIYMRCAAPDTNIIITTTTTTTTTKVSTSVPTRQAPAKVKVKVGTCLSQPLLA